jgi:phenylacetate-coenzyme A ligase PaaK-like adenylate-forming protein
MFAGIKPFRTGRWVEMEGFRPHVIVGRATDLMSLAEHVELGMLDLSSVDHALIVVTKCGLEPVTDVARVVLWQTFGVPVFEIFTGPDYTVLASECELHEGWHLEADVQLDFLQGELVLNARGNTGLRTGMAGRIDEEPCPCGRSTPRVMNVRRAIAGNIRPGLAAIA